MGRTEREKMLAGEVYNCQDEELGTLAVSARRKVAALCASDPGDATARTRLLEQIFQYVGARVHVEPPIYVDYGVHTSIGEDTFINANCVIVDDAVIRIGSRVLLAPAVQLITALHPLRAQDRRTPAADVAAGWARWRTASAPVTIGDDVWIGSAAVILPGVTIGDRVTIGAGSVVTRDIPCDTLAVGTPARVVRSLA